MKPMMSFFNIIFSFLLIPNMYTDSNVSKGIIIMIVKNRIMLFVIYKYRIYSIKALKIVIKKAGTIKLNKYC